MLTEIRLQQLLAFGGLRREESVASQEFLLHLAFRWQLDAGSLTGKFGEQRRYSLGGKKLAILPPVDGNRDDLSRVLPELLLHHCQRLLGCHAGDSQEREAHRQPFTSSRIREAESAHAPQFKVSAGWP